MYNAIQLAISSLKQTYFSTTPINDDDQDVGDLTVGGGFLQKHQDVMEDQNVRQYHRIKQRIHWIENN